MWRYAGAVFIVFTLFVAGSPQIAYADTISVSQTITVTARVAPTRSIVVNDRGQMIKIYSNTSENVAPKVYLGAAPGIELPMTPQLNAQYKAVLKRPGNKIGVAIDVPLPATPKTENSLKNILTTGLSSMLRF